MPEIDAGAHTPAWGRDLLVIVAVAAVLFVLVYASDIMLVARPEIFLGLRETDIVSDSAPLRLWAYVPVERPEAGIAVTAEQGEPIFESHFEAPDLQSNDLYKKVGEVRRRLRIAVDGVRRDGIAYAPLRGLVPWIGGEMQWMGSGKATVFSDDGLVLFTPGKAQAERNYNIVEIGHAPFVADDEFYVPLAGMARMYGLELTGDPASGLFALSRDGRAVRILMNAETYRIEISRSERWVQVYYAGAPAKRYDACIGEGNNTPLGEFHIQNRAVWPGWRAYWDEYIPGGSRRNPLGARWLGTSARGRATGWAIGIHGTNQPSSIGRRISGGCVRLLNKNIIELYEVIPIGTPVTIHE